MTDKPQNTFCDKVEYLKSLPLDDIEYLLFDNSMENVVIITNMMVKEMSSTDVKPKSTKNAASLLILSGEEIMKHIKIRSDIEKLPLPKVMKTFLDDEIIPALV